MSVLEQYSGYEEAALQPPVATPEPTSLRQVLSEHLGVPRDAAPDCHTQRTVIPESVITDLNVRRSVESPIVFFEDTWSISPAESTRS